MKKIYIDKIKEFSDLDYSLSNKDLMEQLKYLIDKGVPPSSEKNYAVIACAEHGRLEELKFLVKDKRVDASAEGNIALKGALDWQYDDVVDYLLTLPEVVKAIPTMSFRKKEANKALASKKMGKYKDFLSL